jgi:predicted HTH transcriptional regulator
MMRIFISSLQKELAAERRALKDFVHNDALLRQHFVVFLFEDLPASDRRTDEVYLPEVDRCDLYMGLFGMEYGYADANGTSPTEHEFDRATTQGKERLIYVLGTTDEGRDPRMTALVRKAGEQLIRKRVSSIPELTSAVYASLIDHLQRSGVIRNLPYDAAACHGASMDDLDPEKVERFLRIAQRERNYVLGPGTPMAQVLTHLNLFDGDRPSHAAVLLFGKAPQRHIGLISSEVKCMHYPTAAGGKPMLDYKIFKGSAFELVDQAVHFVMDKLAHAVGTRSESVGAPITPEIPREVVTEAIVNAVAHRDYASAASVQVELFADRLEVSNPGTFPPNLVGVDLSKAHSSLPHNPLIADPLFLTRYIEKAGTGLMDMYAKCRAAGLPDPLVGPVPGRGVVQVVQRTVQVTDQVAVHVEAVRHSLLEELAVALGIPADQVTDQVTDQVARMLQQTVSAPASTEELMNAARLAHRPHFRTQYLVPIMQGGWLVRTHSQPNHPQQRYRITDKGRVWLERFNLLRTT